MKFAIDVNELLSIFELSFLIIEIILPIIEYLPMTAVLRIKSDTVGKTISIGSAMDELLW